MAKIFISYHHEDQNLADQLAKLLRERDHDVVYSGDALTPGTEWRSVIKKQLSGSDITLALITPRSIQSEWVIAEANTAMAYVTERGRGSVIPVVFEKAPLPQTLREIHAIFADTNKIEEAIDKIDRAINALLGRQLAKEEHRKAERDKVEATAADYIKESQTELRSREKNYRRQAYFWYGAAYLALIAGVAASIWRANLVQSQTGDWKAVIELAIAGIILVGLILAVAKFSFTLGKSFMVEALRNADRSHAISFGEFYLKAFGDNLEWKEVKEAFQHWNIDRGSSFLTQDTGQFDPKLFETALDLAKVLTKTRTEAKDTKPKSG